MSDEDVLHYRLQALEIGMKAIEDQLAIYRRNVMYAVLAGGALANSPLLAQIAKSMLGMP